MRNRVAVGCCAIALLGVTSGCATEGETAGQQTSQASSAAPSVSASAVAATFSLAATSRVDVAEVPVPLIAAAGSITIAEPDGGARQLTVQALDRRGQSVWTLTLQVTDQGRASDGQLVAQGRTWKVTPGTGALTLEQTATALSLTTQRAITLTGLDTPTVNTPMVVSLQGAVK